MTQKKLTYKSKSNAVPVVNRKIQATAEDFNEIKTIVNDNSSDSENRFNNLIENQYSGVKVYETLADLPGTGTLLESYKVSNDPTTANNGYYHWDGAAYVKDASLNNGEVEKSDIEPVEGGKIFSYLNEELDYQPYETVADAYVKASTTELIQSFPGFNVKKYKVKEGDVIHINGDKRGSDVLTVGLFSSFVISVDNLIESKVITNNVVSEPLSISFTVQENVTDLVISNDELLTLTVNKENNILERISDLEEANGDVILTQVEDIASNFIVGSTGELQSGFVNYTVSIFEITGGLFYRVLGGCKGNDVMVAGFYSSNIINADNLVDRILVINNNIDVTDVDISKFAPIEATHIAISKIVDEDIQVYLNNNKQSQTTNLNERVTELEGDLYDNLVVEQMTECDNELSKTYPINYIDVKKEMNNRGVAYKNIIAPFIVPSVGVDVDINLDDDSGLSVSEFVYIGTKQRFDKYQIIALLGGNVVTFNLVEDNLNIIGLTVPVSSIDSPIRVYDITDIERYNSNVFMLPLIRDKYHPTDDGFNLAGDIFSEKIKRQLDSVANLYLFGDSFCDDPYPLASRIASNLGITTSGYTYGFKSQRIEYIYDQFETFISTYTPVAGDFFLFWMGTNNLADIHRNPSDKLEQVLNLSYRDMFMIIAGKISELLPLGNYVIATGFGNTDYY